MLGRCLHVRELRLSGGMGEGLSSCYRKRCPGKGAEMGWYAPVQRYYRPPLLACCGGRWMSCFEPRCAGAAPCGNPCVIHTAAGLGVGLTPMGEIPKGLAPCSSAQITGAAVR
jgi:hypothetical protein